MIETSAWDWFTDLLIAMGSARVVNKYQCPAHGMFDEHAISLSVKKTEGGRAVIYCHAGCKFTEVLAALKLPRNALEMAQLIDVDTWHREFLSGMKFPPPKGGGSGPGSGRMPLHALRSSD